MNKEEDERGGAKRTRDDLKEFAGFVADDASAIRFAHEEDRVRVEVSMHHRKVSAIVVTLPSIFQTHFNVSPKGPTMTTVLSHATTTVLFPHQTT